VCVYCVFIILYLQCIDQAGFLHSECKSCASNVHIMGVVLNLAMERCTKIQHTVNSMLQYTCEMSKVNSVYMKDV
jgi:Fe2+ transport system protein B